MTLHGSPLPCAPASRVVLTLLTDLQAQIVPGTWFMVDGIPTVCCPRCGLVAKLNPLHRIADVDDPARAIMRGDVNASIECPRVHVKTYEGAKQCDAHYYAHLAGWGGAPGAGTGRA